VRLFKRTADQGYALAEMCLASIYAEGRGLERDTAEAARLLQLAADRGVPAAQCSLGEMYAKGKACRSGGRAAVQTDRRPGRGTGTIQSRQAVRE
jgi:TPR repeat protein